jgi:hypothetical protein
LLNEILAHQSDRGAFRSQIQAEVRIVDENCFITLLVLFELIDLLPLLRTTQLENAVERALDFIEHCADPDMPGAFCFYPPRLDSPRPNGVLPPDIDDTVLAWTLGIRSNRRTPQAAADALKRVVEPYTLTSRSASHQPWARCGASLTWLRSQLDDNPIDLCVNVNVLAFYSLCRHRKHPNYAAMLAMLRDALHAGDIATNDVIRLSPYYAHPLEILYAVRRAIESGAEDLTPTRERLELSPWATEDIDSSWPRNRPICCYTAGYPFWIAPALQAARQLSFLARRRSTSPNPS